MRGNIYIIAEIGVNHNGSIELAKTLIDKAIEADVDAVKFQTFKANKLISKNAPKAEYQKITTGTNDSQLDMTKRLELLFEDYLILKQYAEDKGLQVFSTAFDLESLENLMSINQSIWKIPSGEITNLPYLLKISNFEVENKKIILSTGMATMDEIHMAVEILNPQKNEIVVLHCNTEYPTPDDDINISAMLEFSSEFPDLKIGFSDHSIGATAAIMSVAFGAKVIEKHFTLNKDLPGPDHHASATPEELQYLVKQVRRAEKIYGYNKKIVTSSEQKNIVVARKSIVANRNISKGEIFSEENITVKRPGNGISPMKWYEIIGKPAEKSFCEDDLIEDSNFEWEIDNE